MKNAMIAALAALLAIASGCSLMNPDLTSSQQYELADTSYRTAVDAVRSASQADLISLEDLRAFNMIRVEADALLDEWEQSILNGEQFTQREALNRLIDRMIQMRVQVDPRSTSDASHPAGVSDHSRLAIHRDRRDGVREQGRLGGSRSDGGGAGDYQVAA